jgi:hypothetical protein
MSILTILLGERTWKTFGKEKHFKSARSEAIDCACMHFVSVVLGESMYYTCNLAFFVTLFSLMVWGFVYLLFPISVHDYRGIELFYDGLDLLLTYNMTRSKQVIVIYWMTMDTISERMTYHAI